MYDLVIIGGNPGAGKSTVAARLEARGFFRLSIDDFYQKTPRDPLIERWFEDRVFLDAAYAAFKEGVARHLVRGQRVVLETTGVGNRWKAMLAELALEFPERIVTIYLEVSRQASVERIGRRNETDYPIKMSEEELNRFFKLAEDGEAKKAYRCVVNADRPLEEVLGDVVALVDG